MQLRVATDQPWDVKADVLVIPIVGEPELDGPLGELDRRSGGELRTLVTFGEIRARRFTSALAAPAFSVRGAPTKRAVSTPMRCTMVRSAGAPMSISLSRQKSLIGRKRSPRLNR